MKTPLRQTVIFSILVGLAAIFIDAVIAHGVFWENDPYWTYWVTKTFLIITVFGIGTVLLGIGRRQGAIITLFHTLILEVYYEWLSPIGLPQEYFWLPFNDLWTVGFITHYLAIYAGYLLALFLWLRSIKQKIVAPKPLRLLVVSLALVVLDSIITHWLFLSNFPGITFMVQRLLVTLVFISVWAVTVGFNRYRDVLLGSVLLVLIWVAYSMYLEPVGLPGSVRFLGYDDLWFTVLPIGVLITLIVLLGANHLFAERLVPIIILGILLVSVPMTASPQEEAGLRAAAGATGQGLGVVGSDPYDIHHAQAIDGSIRIEAIDGGNRWSHLQNQDKVNIEAEFRHQGSVWRVVSNTPMPRHPLGKYPTWSGVVYGAEAHGDTGIGTNQLPKLTPEIATWSYGEIYRDGQLISRMSPVHAMVMMEDPMKGVMLEVAAENQSLLGAPNGYLTVMWPQLQTIELPESQERQHEILGWLALLASAGWFGALARREESEP